MAVDLKAVEAHLGLQNAMPAVSQEGMEVAQEEIKSTTPPFQVVEISTSVKITAQGTYSSFERGMRLQVNTTDRELIAQAKQLAMENCIQEAVTGVMTVVATGKANNII